MRSEPEGVARRSMYEDPCGLRTPHSAFRIPHLHALGHGTPMDLKIGEDILRAGGSEKLVVTVVVKFVAPSMPQALHDASVIREGELNARPPLLGRRLIKGFRDDSFAVASSGFGIADGEYSVAAIHE